MKIMLKALKIFVLDRNFHFSDCTTYNIPSNSHSLW